MNEFENPLSKMVLPIDATLQNTARVLNENSHKIVFIINMDEAIVGTVTDGDIRRALLKGLEPTTRISEVMNGEPVCVGTNVGREEVAKLMLEKRISQIPTVDGEGKIVGLHLWNQLQEFREVPNKFFIMAGGFGKRLQPITDTIPKPLIQVGDKPILEHIILSAKRCGFYKFVIAIYFLGNLIEEYFGDGKKLGVEIEYIRETSPLGTAGALSLLNEMPSEPIVVTNGDVLTNIDYAAILEFHQRYKADITMAVRLQELQNPFGVVGIDGLRVVNYVEKPVIKNYINAGVYVLDSKVLRNLEFSSRRDMPELIESSRQKGLDVFAYPLHESWIDVGSPIDLQTAQTLFVQTSDGITNV